MDIFPKAPLDYDSSPTTHQTAPLDFEMTGRHRRLHESFVFIRYSGLFSFSIQLCGISPELSQPASSTLSLHC